MWKAIKEEIIRDLTGLLALLGILLLISAPGWAVLALLHILGQIFGGAINGQ